MFNPHVDVAAQLNIRSPSRHVCGNGHRPWCARLGDNVGFLFVKAGIEDFVRNFFLCQQLPDVF